MASRQYTNEDSTAQIEDQIYQTHISDPSSQLNIKVKKSREFKFDKDWGIYPMLSNPKGLALIINNENFSHNPGLVRLGSNVDVQNLEKLCKQLGFKVKTHKNLTREETLKAIEKITKDQWLKTTDMLMVFIMSHGKDKSIICHDGLLLENEEILSKFTCKELKGKPKFIIFNACRGEKKDEGESEYMMTDEEPTQQNVIQIKDPIWQDMLIVYSSIPGYVSFRDPTTGTRFIQTLVKVFMNNAWDKDLFTLLRDIGIEINKIPHPYKQSIEYSIRGFDKKLYFYPGLNKNDFMETDGNISGIENVDQLEKDLNVTESKKEDDLEKDNNATGLTDFERAILKKKRKK